MYRFASRAFKFLLPAGLALYTIKPIFNHDQPEQIPQISPIIQIKLPEPLQNNVQDTVLTTNQPNQEPTTEDIKPNPQNTNSEDENNTNNKQATEQTKSISTLNQNLDQKPEQLQQTEPQINYQQYAEIPPQTPQFIQDYLTMRGIKLIKKQSDSNALVIKNKQGDRATFVIGSQAENNYLVFQLSSFITPLRTISSQEEISSILKNLPEDEYLIATYIPTQEDYKKQQSPKSFLDSFTPSHKIDVSKIEQSFRKQKYASGSNKNTFVIIRDPQIAKNMKMNVNKIGTQYVYYKTTSSQGMETSALLSGIKYTIKSVAISAQKNPISTGLYSYLNQINIEGDLQNFMRSLKLKKEKRKLLVIYSKQKRPQFIKQVKSIAYKAAKMMKEEALVLITENPTLLTQYFQIVPDDFVTIRLINLNKYQQPLISIPGLQSGKKFYSRKVLNGAFNVQNLCRFMKDQSQWKQYYQQKKNLTTIPSVISLNEQIPNNTTVLHWKHGCKGCQLTSSYLESIKTTLENLDEKKIYEYQIQNSSILKTVQFRKFNILNEEQTASSKDHDVTPKLILHTNGVRKNLQVGSIIGKISGINYQNEDEVHKSIMKEIIQTITRAVEEANQNLI